MNETPIDFSQIHQIQLFGITILEPSTVISSLLMTFVCIYAFVKLKERAHLHRMYNLLRYFFLFMGIATAIGGVLGHGFLYVTGMRGKIPGWFASMIAVALMERVAIWHLKPLIKQEFGKYLGWFNYIELAIFFVLTFITLNFVVVEVHAFYGLFLMLFMIEVYIYRKKKDPGSMDVFIATGLGALSAGIHATKFSLGPWFTYNDISHITMGASIWYYYQAAKDMKYYGNYTNKPIKELKEI